ncbi:MAG: hypothetical protein ACI8RP_001584, partial [Urechidicola sp.]
CPNTFAITATVFCSLVKISDLVKPISIYLLQYYD